MDKDKSESRRSPRNRTSTRHTGARRGYPDVRTHTGRRQLYFVVRDPRGSRSGDHRIHNTVIQSYVLKKYRMIQLIDGWMDGLMNEYKDEWTNELTVTDTGLVEARGMV